MRTSNPFMDGSISHATNLDLYEWHRQLGTQKMRIRRQFAGDPAIDPTNYEKMVARLRPYNERLDSILSEMYFRQR